MIITITCHDAREQQGQGNSTAEQVPDDDDDDDDDTNNDEEQGIYFLVAVVNLLTPYLMWCESKKDFDVAGSSTVISRTRLLTEYNHRDHDAEEQQEQDNNTAEQEPSDDDDDDDMNNVEERMICVLVAIVILFITYLMWCDSQMDIVVAGSSTVISKTPLLKEYDHHDHVAGEQQEQGNSTKEQEPYDVGEWWPDDDTYYDKTEGIFFLDVVVILFMTYLKYKRISLISFWNNYVKYYGYFCRWLFLVIIINIITYIISPYQIGSRYHYQWETPFLQFVRLATSVWFFYVAKLIHQQVINLDRRVHHEQATTTSEEEFIDTEQQQQENDKHTAGEVDTTTILPRLLPKYDNIYGQVSRKIDRFFQRQQQQQHLPTDTDILLSTRSSCLVNFSYVLWTIYLSATFYGIADLVIFLCYESWVKECDDNDPSPWNRNTECIQEISLVGSTIVAVLILISTGYWLLIREGLPSGIIPFVVAIVRMWHLSLVKGLFNGNDGGYIPTIIVMTLGTILFHIMLCCCHSENHCNSNSSNKKRLLRHVQLPSWITRNVLIWAVYGWIGAFLPIFGIGAFGAIWFNFGVITITALLLFVFTGIVLHHPIIQLMGICTIVLAILVHILYWLDRSNDFLFLSLNIAMTGIGLIVVGNWISKNSNQIITRCWYVLRFCRCIILCRAATYTD